MKKLIVLITLILSISISQAQEIFFPTKVGAVLVYQSFDKKGKATNQVKNTIKQVKTNGDNLDITYLYETSDAKDKPIFKEEITIQKKGDKLYFDMSNFINKSMFQQNGEIPADLQVKGNNMEIPNNPNPGDLLPDANVEMSLKMGFINMKMSAQVTNRKIEAIEEITVKAGTFKAYKLTSEVNATAMGIKVKTNSIEWYTKGVGVVKMENYDKGQLQSNSELVEIR